MANPNEKFVESPAAATSREQRNLSRELDAAISALAPPPPAASGATPTRDFLSPKSQTPELASNPATNPLHPEKFISHLNNTQGGGDYARPNKFRVTIAGADESMMLNVRAFMFPSKSIMTSDYQLGGGPYVNIPYGILFNDATMTLRCSENHREREFFSKWQQTNIIDESYDLKFHKSMVREITVHQLGNPEGAAETEQAFDKYVCTFHGAFPKTITEIPLDMGATDQVGELNVTFNYTHWSAAASI